MLARVTTPFWLIPSIAVLSAILCHLLMRRMFLASFLSGSMSVVLRYYLDPDYRAYWYWRNLWPTQAVRWWLVSTFIAIVIGFVFLPFRAPRKIILGRCSKCGYDLTGNVSGVCPECGASIHDV